MNKIPNEMSGNTRYRTISIISSTVQVTASSY